MRWGEDMKKIMPIGIENFQELRERYYFVDKTDFIRQLIDQHSKVTLLTRPRRFGKTLTLNMLEYFFAIDREKDSCQLFDGLAIERAGASYMAERGQYPVVFITLKDTNALEWTSMQAYFRIFFSSLFARFRYLEQSSTILADSKKLFRKIIDRQVPLDELSYALSFLLDLLHQHYGKKVILLIDEYDAPIQQAWDNDFYKECISFMKQMLGSALKSNDDLEFAVLTGVLRVAKESIFSDLNNLDVCSVLSPQYDDAVGFTPAEVEKMAADLGMEDRLPEIQQWYDGYRFGQAEIYNPWSVINFFRNGEVGDYWVNTSGNGIIREMLQQANDDTIQNLQSLLSGATIQTAIREGVIYDDIGEDEDALYTMLLTTGYLTVTSRRRGIGGLICELKIPNREVQDIYRYEVLNKTRQGRSMARLSNLLDNLMQGRAEAFAEGLTSYIRSLVSTYDAANKESFYHGFMLGMTALFVPDYIIESNRESGYGRFDLAIFPKDAQKAGVIMEFKAAASEDELSAKAEEALTQIEDRAYDTEFQKRGIAEVWKYGMAFCGKKIYVAVPKKSDKNNVYKT
ncbi:MAG: AAA-ATPase-like domain-containing protein [Mitsuokella multacida]